MMEAYRNSNISLPPARALKKEIISTGTAMTNQILALMKESTTPISICLDGWTNVKRDKVTNILPLCNNVAYYWTSIVNEMESNTSGM
jgi:hypothetical protein